MGSEPNLLYQAVKLCGVLGKQVGHIHLLLLVSGEGCHQTPLACQHPLLQHPLPVLLVVVILVLVTEAQVQVAVTHLLACKKQSIMLFGTSTVRWSCIGSAHAVESLALLLSTSIYFQVELLRMCIEGRFDYNCAQPTPAHQTKAALFLAGNVKVTWLDQL